MTYAIRFWLILLAVLAGASGACAADPQAYRLLRLDGQIVKWGDPALGSPAHITYAFVSQPAHDAKARNCRDMDRLDILADRIGLPVEDVKQQALAAFRLWERVGGVSFTEAADPRQADILIGAQSRPRGYAFANVRYHVADMVSDSTKSTDDRGLNDAGTARGARGEAGGRSVVPIAKSAICLNPMRGWKIGHGGVEEAYDLKYTFAHEIGHAIGLDHYNRPGQLMFFKYSEAFAGPQDGDILGVRALYGPPSTRLRVSAR
ncbi:matrixin family metalloprotease [Breoghania sp. L-A4]|uniref:matrixin family metalloprotease n=1 Tax=Breoghania sp. L-A4 TaxID=2304600 RepID=UPI000E35AA9C|nr:matrixin family metalloprotease [Breoghania sp. L-A4]AXS40368.1 hypothetical protein D1F64_10225 [Breoghania sp. L-A4]